MADNKVQIDIQTTADTTGAEAVDTSLKKVGEEVRNTGDSLETDIASKKGLLDEVGKGLAQSLSQVLGLSGDVATSFENSVGPAIAKIGPLIGVAAVAGTALKKVIEEMTRAQEATNKRAEELSAIYEKTKVLQESILAKAVTDDQRQAGRVELAKQLVEQQSTLVGKAGIERDIAEAAVRLTEARLKNFDAAAERAQKVLTSEEQINNLAEDRLKLENEIATLAEKQRNLGRSPVQKAEIDDLIKKLRDQIGLNDQITEQLNQQTTAANQASQATQDLLDASRAKSFITDLKEVTALKEELGTIRIQVATPGIEKLKAVVDQSDLLKGSLDEIKDRAFQSLGIVVPEGGKLSVAALEAATKAAGQTRQALIEIGNEAKIAEGKVEGITGSLEKQKQNLLDQRDFYANRKPTSARDLNNDRDNLTRIDSELKVVNQGLQGNSVDVKSVTQTISDNSGKLTASLDALQTKVDQQTQNSPVTKSLDDLEKKVEQQTTDTTAKVDQSSSKITDTGSALQTAVAAIPAHIEPLKAGIDNLSPTLAAGLNEIVSAVANLQTSIQAQLTRQAAAIAALQRRPK